MRTLKAKEGYIMTKTIKLTAYECGTVKAHLQFAVNDSLRTLEKLKEENALEDDIYCVEKAIEVFKSVIDKIEKAEYKD